ncbi:MAG: hypothetical protein L0Z53_10100 [Acidobacteriales bacterium]|nr:hypothetical protein [Terriglobales bacterium]
MVSSRPAPGYSQTGETIPASGIYRVHHKQHRVPHEVTLIKDEIFPPCERCSEAVRFKLVRAVADADDKDVRKFGFKLYCLPVMEEISTQDQAPAEDTDKAA